MSRLAAIAGLLLITAPAFAADESPLGRCLSPANLGNFSNIRGDNSAVIVRDYLGKRYRVSLTAPCYDLKQHYALSFKTFSSSRMDCIAPGDRLLVSGPIGGSCVIRNVMPQTPEMDAADQAKWKKS